MDTFRTSRNAVVELASRYKEFVTQLRANNGATHDEEAEKLLFTEMFEICLWGNATDLSLLTNLTKDGSQKENKIKNYLGPHERKRRDSIAASTATFGERPRNLTILRLKIS